MFIDSYVSFQTRILVTHGVHWLPKVDNIFVLANGEIMETGSYEELLSHNGDFAHFLRQHLTANEDSDFSEEDDESKKYIKSNVSLMKS